MILPLQLRQDPALDADAAAWFLPGDSVEHWLEELARSGLAGADTRLFVVPCSVGNRACAGLLVVPAVTNVALPKPAGVACRSVAGRLFVPADAVLHPPVTDAEVRTLCPLPVSFYHPAFGLSSFEEESTLRIWNLIQRPAERTDPWNLARPGAPALPELSEIMLAQPPSIEDVFGGAEEEIGSEPPVDLPPMPDEPGEDLPARTQRTLRRLFAKGVSEVTRQMPHIGYRRTWVNDVEDWANRQLRGVNDQLDKLRNKELHRLLRLLDTDPEAGLRHAIPMNALAHRGLAPPGARLGARLPNFDLNRLGGGPADFWNVPLDLQTILSRRYREMADREMQLGRHRRAAYIYAQLLGDLVSAANALKQGRHFREAALLYEEHLKNPVEAARCLAEGGLLAEAIERYIKLGRWLDVADLHARLGNRNAAEEAVRRVVNEHLAQDDILGAARLVDERLQLTDEALALLLNAWPASRQAGSCVAAAFQMLARLGRHEVALEYLAQFGRGDVAPRMVLPLLTALGGPARDYPHEQVRHRAADFSRVLIARQLGQTGLAADEAGRVVECLVRLAPRDRLLARDANRHLLDRRNTEQRARRVTPPPRPGNKPIVVRRFELPRQIQWQQLRHEWHWFYALGVTHRHLTLVRGIWEGDCQSLSWDCTAQEVQSGFVFEPTAERGRAVALARASGRPLGRKRFPAADAFFGQECIAGTPDWLPAQSYPLTFGEDVAWSLHLAAGQAVLSCHDKTQGRLQRTIDATEALLGDAHRSETTRLCLAALPSGVAMTLGNRLVLTRRDGGLTRVELPGQAIGLVATLPHTRSGIAVLLEHGAVMHWAGVDVGSPIELSRDLASPLATFVPGGPMVLVSDAQMMLLDVDSRGVQKVTRVELTGQRPVGVCYTAAPGQFAVLGDSGEMTVYRVPL